MHLNNNNILLKLNVKRFKHISIMNIMKILFIASYPNQPIGYSKVANKLSNFLAEKGAEVYYFGFSNFPESTIKRYIHPNIKFIDVIAEEKKLGFNELYGINIIDREMRRIKPDILFIYNDIIVICRLMNALLNYHTEFKNTYKTYIYIDLVYDFEKPLFIEHVDRNSDRIFVFSEHWKINLIQMNVPCEKIEILYHGVDALPIINKETAREKIGLKKDDFIILNTNRNSYRKAWDITIAAFLFFLKKNSMNPNIKLYINCNLQSSSGYDIISLIKTECIRQKLDYSKIIKNHILNPNKNAGQLEDYYLYLIYNSCDIGINTCLGEGFGLCNIEHATLGISQVVSKVGGLSDIFGKYGKCIEPVSHILASNLLDEHNGYLHICRPEDFADALDFYYKYPEYRVADGKAVKNYILEKYNWNTILDEFWKKEIEPFNIDKKEIKEIKEIFNVNSSIKFINLEGEIISSIPH
jgi:glycosyltransferase involved in cell wall biosynthesis